MTPLRDYLYTDSLKADGGTRLRYVYSSGYLIFQVLCTPEPFQSRTFKLHEFTASNGVTIGSKNSPLFVGPDRIFLQGAFREFDLKPTVYPLGSEQEYYALIERQREALREFDVAVWQADYKPRIKDARDGIEDL